MTRKKFPANTLKLRRTMAEFGMNCRQIGELIGLSHVTIKRWHAGIIEPTDRDLDYLRLKLRHVA